MLPLFIASLVAFEAAFAGAKIPAQFCVKPQMARLTSSERCWAQWRLEPNQVLCLSRPVWESMNSESRIGLSGGCMGLNGEWQVAKLKSLEAIPGKTSEDPTLYFYADSQINKSPIPARRSIVWRFIGWIEHFRNLMRRELTLCDHSTWLRILILRESQVDIDEGMLFVLGFVHVTSATGIHLYFLGDLCRFISGWLGTLLGLSALRSRQLSRVMTVFFWSEGWALAGFRLGMLRPLFLVHLQLISREFGFKWKWGVPLILSILGEAVFHFAGSTHGFLSISGLVHSFLSIGGALIWVQMRESSDRSVTGFKKIKSQVRMALASSLLPMIVGMAWNGWISLATPFINLITLPFWAGLFYPLGLLCALGIQFKFLDLSRKIIQVLSDLSSIVLEGTMQLAIQCQSYFVVSHGWFWIAVSMAGASLLFSRRRVYLLLLCLAVSVGSAGDRPRANQVAQLDIGQGDAAFVTTRSKGLGVEGGMIDVGPIQGARLSEWIKFFANHEVTDLKWIGLTHLDQDHVGGLQDLAAVLPIKCVSLSSIEAHSRRVPKPLSVLRSVSRPRPTEFHFFQSDRECIPFPVLSEIPNRSSARGNKHMAAFWVPIERGGAYLNLGDSSQAQERAAIPWVMKMKSETPGPIILKVSHHGSKSSSDPEFLKKVSPQAAWISVGARNHYGHPSPRVTKILEQLGIPPYRTDVDGTLIVGEPSEIYRHSGSKE